MAYELDDEELLERFEKEADVVKTSADKLVKLVNQKGEISFEDSANELNVSQETIEAWANFLEEEKIISIKYNFTTPLLTVFEQKKKKPKEETIEEETLKKKPAEQAKRTLKKEELTEIHLLLGEAYSYIKKKKFDKAKEIYALIKGKYDGLPSEFLEKKNELNTHLTKLSKDLGVNLSKLSIKEMEKKSQYLKKLLKLLEQKIKNKDLLGGIKTYGQIRRMYDNLPDGFIEQKVVLQNKIIELYGPLITIREEQDIKDMSTKKTEIINLLEETRQSINERNMPLAIKLYEKIRKIYNSLSEGFLQERAELQAKIIPLYEEILLGYKKITSDDMENKTIKIEELSKLINQSIAKKDLESAKDTYNKIKDVFYSLPEGFLKQKTELHKILLNLYEKLSAELDKKSSEDFNIKYHKIDEMLGDAFSYVKNKKFNQASELYKKIISLYNAMPSGFLERKTQLRTRILTFYRDMSSELGLEKNIFEVPKIKKPLDREETEVSSIKTEIEVPSIKIKQLKQEETAKIKKPVLQIQGETIPQPQIKKPTLIQRYEMPKIVRPRTLPPFPHQKTIKFVEGGKLPKPIPKPPPFKPQNFHPSHLSMPTKFVEEKKLPLPPKLSIPPSKPIMEHKPSFFKLFKKSNKIDLMPPTPPGFKPEK